MKRLSIALASLAIAGAAMAQNQTSPYSLYGYGIIGDRATSMQRQMGGVGYAMNSGRQINVMNPASYAAIDSLTFLFDIGADVSLLWSKDDNSTQRTTGGGVDYITMQFPISKNMGMSVGLVPYTSVGYAFGTDIAHGTMSNQGQGGINELYLGWSGKIKGFSLGFNVSYDFGNIINDVFTETNTNAQAKFEHVMEIRDWNINIGAQYTHKWNKYNKAVVGVTYSPKKTLLGKTWMTVQETTQDQVPDTLGYMKMRGNYFTPNTVGVGLSYTYEKASRIMVEADMTWQQWSKATYSPLYDRDNPGEVLFQGMNFKDRTRFAIGGEYIPKIRGNYGQRMAYRLGAYHTADYISVRGNRVKEMGITCGFGLPTYEGKTMLNLGFEWKRRWASPQALLSENYFNITLGINFNEVWFWQRKIR
ncbi:MAG: hypothetical protein HDS79_05960 [Bacteroidales bacterium]|nr:hypothetical protein [Bacteroidales bacterium]MDE7464868.1 hypothetical protein [Muribaculaceae bacterium]